MSRTANKLTMPRFWAVAAGVALAMGAVGYGFGRLQGSAQIKEAQARVNQAEERVAEEVLAAERRHEANVKAASDAQEAFRAQLSELERRRMVLESRRQLALVLSSLDDHNFGTASQHLERATQSLRSAQFAGERAQTVVEALAGAEIVVARNVGAERQRFRAIADALDDFIEDLPQLETNSGLGQGQGAAGERDGGSVALGQVRDDGGAPDAADERDGDTR